MSKSTILPVNEANHFGRNEIIVSKTDLKGRIAYANDVFCRLAEMPTNELIGAPHSVIRHPDMPRTVFHLLWETIGRGEEIFAYVKNMARSGKYYWVFAHVTPSFDKADKIDGYHSNRRSPDQNGIIEISKLYAELLRIERSFANAKDGLVAGKKLLADTLAQKGKSYSEFVWGLENGHV